MDFQDYLGIGFFSGVILMSTLHGVLLALILLCNKNLNSKSNRYLAMALLGICVILAYEFVYWLDLEDKIPVWIQYAPLYIRTTIPVGIFYFVLFLVQPKHRLSKFEKLGLWAIALELLLETTYIPVNLFLKDSDHIAIAEDYIIILGWFLCVFTAMVFLPLALRKVNQYQKFLYDNYSTTERKSLRWLQVFLALVFLGVVLGGISFLQYVLGYYDASESTFAIVVVGFVLLLFAIGYFLILQYGWFEIAPLKNYTGKVAPISGKLSDNTNAYYSQLMTLLQDEKIYEDVDLTLDKLSERLQISSGYLSQIIKEKEKKSFFEFINFHRIASVKEKLMDTDYKNYTIMGIALESGFNSKSTFNAVFKKFTNETPSTFKRRQA
ncbi:AraC family transcriptional regulator [Ulvibacterium sp.]|uniref:helix-turn-helix domain-containing protein n=1 Tax=Ulvibacterium sp. TaxID=2665914 RepID=UPI002612276F|nr:helix-turn-helix domain-containing protein [Ulvibacterium sp.]